MSISQVVHPISDVKLGILSETTFGTLLDNSGTDTQNYRQLPVLQATKPTFNIHRESRLLSGRGLVKNAADTVLTTKGGTVTCPFDMIATPELLLQHLAMVTNTYNADGSDVYTVEVDGTSNRAYIGQSITSAQPHTVNLAYYPTTAQGIVVPGCTVSDLTITGDLGSNGGNLSMAGNYFSGFSNKFVAATGWRNEVTVTPASAWVEPDAGVFINCGSLSTKQLDVEGADQDLILKSFNLNISNGVNRVGSNSEGGAEAYAFPEYVVTGDITVKYDAEISLSAADNVVEHFLNGNTGTLALKFGDGTVSSESEMNILAEIQYTGDPAQDISENGIFWTIPFECVQNSSTEALKISLFSGTALTAM